MTTQPRIFLDHLGVDYLPVIQAGMEWIDIRSQVKWGDTVFVKPNLTYPTFRRGVMTNPECVEAVVVHKDNPVTGLTAVEAKTKVNLLIAA